MVWNWQQRDWLEFKWSAARLVKAEEQFLLSGGVYLGSIAHLQIDVVQQLTVETLCDEAVTSSEIEGEFLDRESVQSSLRRELGFSTDGRRVRPSEQGISEAFVDLYRTFQSPLTDETLFKWHRLLMKARTDLFDVGRFRTQGDPVQVVSSRTGTPRVHFEAPPSASIATEMSRFIDWFSQTGPAGLHPLPALTRAGIAHLYFESIHPFEDGNGRLGRMISEKALAQSIGRPCLTALAAIILAHRRAYYDAFEKVNTSNEVTEWLVWFAETTLEAQGVTLAQVAFLISKTHLLDRVRGKINSRQEAALMRMFREGPAGFVGGMSANKYMSITNASPATATRDLVQLVELGALTRTGTKRQTRYHLAIPTIATPRYRIGPTGILAPYS